MSDHYQRLPIYQDHQPRRHFEVNRGMPSSSVFDEMRRHMADDWGSDPFSHTRTYRVRPFGMGLDDDFDSLCKDFFELKPRNPLLSSMRDSGSRESLDEDKVIKPTGQGHSRKFQMSFDVKDYEPQDISVKVDNDTLIVEARREADKDGMKSSKQFSRSVHIPKDVDPDKLISSLSKDGVLTIEAPIPPQYQSVAYVDPKKSVASSLPQSTYSGYNPPSVHSHMTTSVQSPHYPQSSASSSFGSPYQPSPASTTVSSSGDCNYGMPPPPAYPGPRTEPPPQPKYPAPPPPLPKTGGSSASPGPAEPAAAAAPSDQIPLDTPVFTTTPQGRRLDLIVELGKPYTSDDILVKLEGRQLQVEAEHIEKMGGKKSKSCMSREFDLDEDIDPRTVQANFDDNGRLIVAAMVLHKSEDNKVENGNHS